MIIKVIVKAIVEDEDGEIRKKIKEQEIKTSDDGIRFIEEKDGSIKLNYLKNTVFKDLMNLFMFEHFDFLYVELKEELKIISDILEKDVDIFFHSISNAGIALYYILNEPKRKEIGLREHQIFIPMTNIIAIYS